VSNTAAEGLSYASHNKKVTILPNGIDHKAWKLRPIAHPEIRVTAVMRMTNRKRPLALIRSIPQILSRIQTKQPVKFCLIGDGVQLKKIINEVKKLNLEQVVELTGFLPRAKIKEVFAKSDIFASPTLKEAFGIAILEARCAGLPIVAMHYGGVKDVISDGQDGFLAKNDSEFVDHIVTLINDTELRRKIANNNSKKPENFSWNSVIKTHITAYQNAMESMNSFRQKKGSSS
jgi:glycosyltransferase involved in cell wall biosynthesis